MNLKQATDDGRAAAIIGAARDTNPYRLDRNPELQSLHVAWDIGYANARDWTRGAENRSNTAPLFLQLCDDIERVIRNSGQALINGQANTVACLIMAKLAHDCDLAPSGWRPGDPPPEKKRR